MARTTNDPKTRFLRVRINDKLEEELSHYENISEKVRELIEAGLHEPTSAGNVLPGITQDESEELIDILDMFDMTVGDALKALITEIQEGYLTIDEKRFITDCDIREFLSVCKENKIDPQETMDSVVSTIRKKHKL